MVKAYTTLNKIKREYECHKFYKLLIIALKKQKPDDEPLSLRVIMEHVGLEHALLCLKTLDDKYKKDIAKYAIDCAENVLDVYEASNPKDLIPRKTVDIANTLLNQKTPKKSDVSKLSSFADKLFQKVKSSCDAPFYSVATCANAAYATCEAFREDRQSGDIAYDTYFAAWSANAIKANIQRDLFIKHFDYIYEH